MIYSDLKDVFFPWSQDEIFLSVHSPFVPVNPLTQGHNLEPGVQYNVYVRLEEEHLQPPPYKTNCMDYEALWNRNNKTGPRSQKMCEASCYLSYSRKHYGCENAKLILYEPENLCRLNVTNSLQKLHDVVEPCRRRCKQSCFRYITLSVFVRDTDVTVLKHNPLYGAWQVFSYVGGLLGCWLGISVWTCFGITEKYFKKLLKLSRNSGMNPDYQLKKPFH
ncbi:hypothetical protein AVEN_268686-1 [Araneus ventricosus]|uniref:Uncharacterized protein n=1 Tax=Araneus ventricosus TaxID=182803 RepID=A0A4Y2PI08_ARAVE|nr:hypothetical protein AVEN_268686-1 [Araneus ventricosus]